MQPIKKFTFKKDKKEGRLSCCDSERHEIKVKDKIVGDISRRRLMGDVMPTGLFCVTLYEIDNDATFIQDFQTVTEAKEWLNKDDIIERVNKSFKLKLT